MNATPADIETLERLQAVDLELLRTRKEFEELPQRAVIAAAQEKRAALQEKMDQIKVLRKETGRKLTRSNEEDASLVKKEHGIQAALEAAQGDYRNVEARTKELAGIEKRRFKLKEELAELKKDQSRIDKLASQISDGIKKLDAAEEQATASFEEQGGALTASMESLEKERAQLTEEVPPALMEAYDRVLGRSGGVAIGRLVDNRCGVCRAPIESGRLIDLRNQAPLGECPSCKRLLVIGAPDQG